MRKSYKGTNFVPNKAYIKGGIKKNTQDKMMAVSLIKHLHRKKYEKDVKNKNDRLKKEDDDRKYNMYLNEMRRQAMTQEQTNQMRESTSKKRPRQMANPESDNKSKKAKFDMKSKLKQDEQ